MSDFERVAPPFNFDKAIVKVRRAEDAWNSRDAVRVSEAYSFDSIWRNRNQFVRGRKEIIDFLTEKWDRELEYRLVKELWTFDATKIAVRFQYEWNDGSQNWYRSYGNELWEFDANGLMTRREASINDVAIAESDRRFFWDAPGPRPISHPGLFRVV